MEGYNRIYPQVPINEDPLNFRLQKSCEVVHNLQKEIRHYEDVRKKYNRARGIYLLKSVLVAGWFQLFYLQVDWEPLLLVLGAVVGIPLGAVGGLCGGISVGFGAASKRLSHKVSKHEQTVSLAKAKVNTIHDLVSKALQDNAISDQEFSLILAEVDNFEKLKLEIRRKDRKDTEKKLKYESDKNRGSCGNFKGVNRSRTLKFSFERTPVGWSYEVGVRKERC